MLFSYITLHEGALHVAKIHLLKKGWENGLPERNGLDRHRDGSYGLPRALVTPRCLIIHH